uniref:Uncharacterized protein n=1 Tax=Oncorhynchus kisutch TaxID=8019 RepID=A0A8C7DY73_ONCKI
NHLLFGYRYMSSSQTTTTNGAVVITHTIQIMIGLMILLTGNVMTLGPQVDHIGGISGIFVWGSIIVSESGRDNCQHTVFYIAFHSSQPIIHSHVLFLLYSAGIILYHYYCDHPGNPSCYPPSYYWVYTKCLFLWSGDICKSVKGYLSSIIVLLDYCTYCLIFFISLNFTPFVSESCGHKILQK